MVLNLFSDQDAVEYDCARGKLKEVAINYFAVSKKAGNVYYFGADTREDEDGKVKSTAGSWPAGGNGAKYGLIRNTRRAWGSSSMAGSSWSRWRRSNGAGRS